jgi:Sec-independent protein translocase protein TatA
MDGFLGIGFGEIVVILILALVFLGPEKSIEFARTLSKLMNNLKKASATIKGQLEKEVDEQKASLKDMISETKTPLKDMISETKAELQSQARDVSQTGKEFIQEVDGHSREIANHTNQLAGDIKTQGKTLIKAIEEPFSENNLRSEKDV